MQVRQLRRQDRTRWTLPLVIVGTGLALVASPVIAATIHGTPGDDRLVGTSSADTIHGYGGNDEISPRGGDDVVFAGNGDDYVDLGWSRRAGDDRAYAGRGSDDVSSGKGDRVHLGPGHDFGWSQGGTGAVVRGGDGSDVLRLDTGPARLYGGPGNDVVCGPYLGGERPGPYRYWLGEGDDRAFHGGPTGDWCYEQHNSAWRDVVFAGPGADFLRFGSGGGGRDAAHAGPGDDTVIVANRRHKIVRCGPGRDRLVLRGGAEPEEVSGCELVERE